MCDRLKADATRQIRLRALEPSDADRLYIWENDPEMRLHGSAAAPWSRHQLWEYATNYDADPIRSGQLRLVIERTEGNEAVGCIDLYDIDSRNRHAFVGIMIAREHRQKGYAREAMLQIADYCTCSLGLHSLAATVAADNTPSLKLFASCGFSRRGTLYNWLRIGSGNYADAVILQIDLDCDRPDVSQAARPQ